MCRYIQCSSEWVIRANIKKSALHCYDDTPNNDYISCSGVSEVGLQ